MINRRTVLGSLAASALVSATSKAQFLNEKTENERNIDGLNLFRDPKGNAVKSKCEFI
jgi:hypothetical protein